MNAKTAMLQALLDGEGYALNLIDRVLLVSGLKIHLHQGNVYPLLRDMEHDGLLESRDGEPLPERGGRPRRYYKLTEAGRKEAGQQEPTEWEKLLANYCGWLERYVDGMPERDEAEAIRRAMKRGIRSEHEARIVLLAAGSFGDGAADGRDALERVRSYGQLHLDALKRHS